MYFEISGYIYHQGTYTPQAGNEKGAAFLPFTGVRPHEQRFYDKQGQIAFSDYLF